jgi:GH25 family lysozyme M1 (1,4-beta-N-acetylmuramidase)
MKLTDTRLWQAKTFEDFQFRLGLDENENGREQNRRRHFRQLYDGADIADRAYVLQAYVTPNPAYVLGMDDSHWGGVLDFTNTYARGMRFAWFKCVDGTVPTRYWDVNHPASIKAGLLTGSYGWLYPNNKVSCKLQAAAYWDRIKNVPKQLPPVIDFEWTYWGGSPAFPNYSDLDLWVTEFTRLNGIKPVLYTAAGYMNQFGAMPAALKAKFSFFWFANYGTSKPTLPTGFTTWDFWQWASTLEQAYYAPSSVGKKELDGNYFSGTLQELQQIAGGTTPPPPPIGGTMKYGTVVTPGLNIRTGPGTTNADIGDLLQGDEVISDSQSANWWHLTDAKRNGVAVKTVNGQTVAERSDVWAAYQSGTGTTIYIQGHAAPPTEPPPPTEDSVHMTLDVIVDVNGKKYGKTYENQELPPL